MTPLEALHDAAIHCGRIFTAHRDELQDLRPSFWASLADLEFATDGTQPHDEVFAALKAAYKRLGAPGDFGYGTPCGDALQALYSRWNEFSAAVRDERENAAALAEIEK